MTVAAPPRRLTVALLGNPNTGKTTLFNALSGLNHRVGNYPGVTVESKKGTMSHAGVNYDVVDLPGTYSLAPRSPDEMVAVDVILGQLPGEPRPDVVVCIVDGSNLERNLYLTTQALELGVPVVVALNMIDVAERQGIRIDAAKLGDRLGVPVVPIQANKRVGLDALRAAIAATAGQPAPTQRPMFPEAFEREVATLATPLAGVPPVLLRRLLLDVGGTVETRFLDGNEAVRTQVQQARSRLVTAGCPIPAIEARTRYAWLRDRVAGCVERPAERPSNWTDRLDRVLTHRLYGTLLFAAVMFLMFQSIYTLAKPLMDLVNAGKDALAKGVEGLLPAGPFTSLLSEGVIGGVGAVIVFLPQILILFAFIAVLEDCGYMARAAFLMDRLMSRCGLSGKSFIPMLSSMACAVPGIMATRVIEDRRDRLATILVAPLMSCSARLPVYLLITAAFLSTGYPWWLPGLVMFGMYLIGLVVAPLVALALKRTLLRGQTPVFVLEMPAYKWPSVSGVLRRVHDAGWMFVRRAGTVILASMVLVWALLNFPEGDYRARIAELEGKEGVEDEVNRLRAEWKQQSLLGRVGQALEPVVRPLGWDWKLGVAALASFPAREVVVGTLGVLYEQGEVKSDDSEKLGEVLRARYSIPTAVSLMVFFALCCQCASTLAVIRRETQSWLWPAFTFGYMTALAYLGALVVYQVGALL